MAFAMETSDTEVPAKARRRRFTAEYKQKILREAERCRKAGEIGALLRREGLYSSHLTAWRAARASGERAGLEAKRRGTKPRVRDGQAQRVAELEREVTRWKGRAERAEFLVELQKKVASILGIELDENGERR
jgi:transposase-like protein